MLKLIIVEDEDIIRKGLVYTIDWLGMDCVVVADAADGEEGLEKILKFRPDVVITDIRMPRLDGFGMVEKAKESVNFRSVFLTSFAEFEYARKALELKATDYLLKPVDEEKIRTVIREIHFDHETDRAKETVLEGNKNQGMDFDHYMGLDTTENGYVTKAILEIRAHYAQKISVDSIAQELGVSTSYLSRKFKEVTGHTFLDFLNIYRVQQAVTLLQTSRYRVYEVSDRTGFSDYKHFCAVFKRYTSMSPTVFMKRRR